MKKKEFTHRGYEEGTDARTAGHKRLVKLRETKDFWVSEQGRKFSKKRYGYVPGDWPLYRLDLNSVKLIDPEHKEG